MRTEILCGQGLDSLGESRAPSSRREDRHTMPLLGGTNAQAALLIVFEITDGNAGHGSLLRQANQALQ